MPQVLMGVEVVWGCARRWSSLGKGPEPTSCLTLQLEKVYDPKNEEDDMREMEEERLRMREHVMKNVRRAQTWAGVAGCRGPAMLLILTWLPRWTPTKTAS